MDEYIHVELVQMKHAPWGLMTEEEHPRIILWLTEDEPRGQINRRFLTPHNIEAILRSSEAGIVRQSGLSRQSPQMDPSAFGISPEVAKKILDMADLLRGNTKVKVTETPTKTIVEMVDEGGPSPSEVDITEIDITKTIQEAAHDITTSFFKEDQVEIPDVVTAKMKKLKDLYDNNPFIAQLLEQHGAKVNKDLKQLAKGRVPKELFSRILKAEESGRNRKSVLLLVRKILREKIEKMAQVGQGGGLENTYYALIEDEEDEEIIRSNSEK